MKIAHASDTHDRPSIVKAVADLDADIILLTGDILGNKGRMQIGGGGWDTMGPSFRISAPAERKYQDRWFRKVAKTWAPAFKGRPVIYVPGNHDFIGIEKWLTHYGFTNLHVITDATPCVEIMGRRFAGFRQINYMMGEWMGEERDLRPHVERALACDPDILVTHAPPAGLLDGEGGYGIVPLTPALMYGTHRITHHFFGHEHSCGGEVVVEGGITFVNGAGTLRVHEVP